jgi:hypothetical protein
MIKSATPKHVVRGSTLHFKMDISIRSKGEPFLRRIARNVLSAMCHMRFFVPNIGTKITIFRSFGNA